MLLLQFRTAIETIARQHEPLHECDYCFAARGDREALIRVFLGTWDQETSDEGGVILRLKKRP